MKCAGLTTQRKLKPGRKALNEVLVHVVSALKSPNRRDGLKFGIFVVRSLSPGSSSPCLPRTPELSPESSRNMGSSPLRHLIDPHITSLPLDCPLNAFITRSWMKITKFFCQSAG